MRRDKRNIFVTRELDGQQQEYARILGLEPHIQSALTFEFPEYWNEVLKVINDHPKSEWVFTSSNGVKALEKMMESGLQVRPETTLFAVGAKTADALHRLGLEAKTPPVYNAESLADFIGNEGKVSSIIYFHGNLSRDTLVSGLEEENIEVVELEVYQTNINEVYLPAKPVSAVLFYSPSAVKGFEKGEGFDRDLPLLCAIGDTTAGALRDRTGQEILVADRPDTRIFLRNVSEYLFSRQKAE